MSVLAKIASVFLLLLCALHSGCYCLAPTGAINESASNWVHLEDRISVSSIAHGLELWSGCSKYDLLGIPAENFLKPVIVKGGMYLVLCRVADLKGKFVFFFRNRNLSRLKRRADVRLGARFRRRNTHPSEYQSRWCKGIMASLSSFVSWRIRAEEFLR